MKNLLKLEISPIAPLESSSYVMEMFYYIRISVCFRIPVNIKLEGGLKITRHVMYGDRLPVHLAENCSSKNVRTMFNIFLWEFVKDGQQDNSS